MLERALECVKVVEFDNSSGFGGIDGRADIAAARADDAVFERGEGFVDCAVVAEVEDEDLRALGDFAGDSNDEAVGVGGSERELPVGEAEAALEIFADPEGIFGGKHEGDARAHAAGDGFGDNVGRVASHGAGVAEAEVDVFAAVHVGEVRAFGGLDEDRESAGPFFHPVHGDAAEEGGLGALVKSGGLGMVGEETGFLALLERF